MIRVIFDSTVETPITKKLVEHVVVAANRVEKKITGVVEVTIVGEKRIRRINRDFRGKDKVTDVISFGWQEDSLVPSDVLGEIYICYKQIERQAKHFKCSTKEEFARMLAHGLLHSVGYDHISKSQASRMFPLQERIVSSVMKS
jgi:probable rRNA maturation factor